jgi:glycosyltransferase involved in cell wall biosynthesis
MKFEKILLIIPCFNEQESIVGLIKEIKDISEKFSILVIDDGSTDDTYLRSVEVAPTIKLLRNLGIGGAVQTGIRFARDCNFDFCIQIDGDGQHPPNEILKLLRAYQENSTDIVIGSRYIQNDSFRSTLARRSGSKLIAWILNILFGVKVITDPTSGFRMMNSKAIKIFSENYPCDYPEPISIAWGILSGLQLSECAVNMRSREAGVSSIAGIAPIIYMTRVVGYILLARLFKR